jgi:hypothetical protein
MDADSPGNVVFKSHHRLIKFSIYFYLLFLLTYFFSFGLALAYLLTYHFFIWPGWGWLWPLKDLASRGRACGLSYIRDFFHIVSYIIITDISLANESRTQSRQALGNERKVKLSASDQLVNNAHISEFYRNLC